MPEQNNSGNPAHRNGADFDGVVVAKSDERVADLVDRSLAVAGLTEQDAVAVVVIAYARTANGSPSSMSWLSCGSISFNSESLECRVDGKRVVLTPREGNVLLQLLEAFPAPLRRSELLDAVWGTDFVGDSNVADVYLSYLRKKLGRDRIQTIRGVGYRLVPDES